MEIISSEKVKKAKTADLAEDSGEEQVITQKTAAVQQKEEEAAKEAQTAEKSKYKAGDLKSFLALADESTGNHKKFARDPYLLDEFARNQRAQPPQMTHGLLLSILLFFLNIVTFLGGKGWNGPILPQKIERQPIFPLKLDPEKLKILKNAEKMEFDANNHHIEILKSDIAQHNAQAGVVGLKGIIIDGTRFDFGSLCGELTQKCGHDKAVEILSTISDFAMLSITPEHERAARVGIIQKQHEGVLKKMEKSQSDIAAEKVFARYQASKEEPRARPEFVSEAEKKRLLQRLEKNQEDAKTYRPSPTAARSNQDDDNAPRPGA